MKLRPIVSPAAFFAFMLLTLCVITSREGTASYQKADAKAAQKTEAPAATKKGEPPPAAATPKAATRQGKRGQTSPGNPQGVAITAPGEDVDDAGGAPAAQTGGQQPEGNRAGTNQNANAATKSQPANAATPAEASEQGGDWVDSMLYWGIRVLGVLGVLLVLGLIGYGVKTFVDSSRERTEAHFADVKRRQDELARKTGEALKLLSNRVAEVQSEVKEMRRVSQDDSRTVLDAVRRAGASSAAAYASYPSSGYAASAPRFEREEPTFPTAAEDYLNKNRRGAVVVKTDFQNGILVQDSEGSGELMLVRDPSAPDELLYAVPRIGYFQTKQDFLNYYDRYYECSRPSAGMVWIVQPAVVDRVSGGWSLREKGELEVR